MKKRLQRRIESGDRDRRGAIRYALFRRICDKGYASTSLSDLAAAVGISPSHLLYYYPNKDAVLEDLFAIATRHMHDDLAAMPWNDPGEALDALADYFFGGETFSRNEQASMLQFWALSANHPSLRKTKADFDSELRRRLTESFARTDRLPGLSAGDAAEVAHGLLAGFLSTTYFSDPAPPDHVRALFRSTLAHLAGAPAPIGSVARPARSRPRRPIKARSQPPRVDAANADWTSPTARRRPSTRNGKRARC